MKAVILNISIAVLSSFTMETAKAEHPESKTRRIIHVEIGEGAGPDRVQERDRRHYNHRAHHYYNRKLRERIRILESAVQQMQADIDQLFRENRELKSAHTRYACYLKTPFDGTFLGKGSSLIEARAVALNQCEQKTMSWCKESRVKCSKT